jgi:hypothetical protein
LEKQLVMCGFRDDGLSMGTVSSLFARDSFHWPSKDSFCFGVSKGRIVV